MPKDEGVSDDERELFRKSVQNVKPLKHVPSGFSQKPTLPAISVSISSHRTPEQKSGFFPLSSYLGESIGSETILHYHRSGLSKKHLKSLKNGGHRIEALLDLHGCIPEVAQDALCAFITTQHQLNRRHLLIIHGKGGRHGEPPVIKNLVNRWLPQFPQVLAFHSAQARDGGAGALYVLLKKSSPLT